MMTSSNKNLTPTSVTSASPAIDVSSSSLKKERRRAKRKAAASSKDEAPMFLRKAFHIVNTCDPTIAAWSEDGKSFFVKDQDRFASEIIPKCFKHNHFSSFVRQLNFYGFRKLREDHIELDTVDEAKSRWCHFRHAKFQRGRPDLLKEISKNTHKEVAEKTELDALRAEVKDLRAMVQNMKKDMGVLAALVGDLSHQARLQTSGSTSSSTSQPPLKKQRLEMEPVKPDPTKSVPAVDPAIPTKPVPFGGADNRVQSQLSAVSFTSEDEEFLTSLFVEDGFDGDLDIPDAIVSWARQLFFFSFTIRQSHQPQNTKKVSTKKRKDVYVFCILRYYYYKMKINNVILVNMFTVLVCNETNINNIKH